MRIALCNEVIAAMPFERQCAFARSVGYDAIEIAPFTLTDDPARLPTAQAAAWRRAATDAGIAITSLHYLLRAPSGLSITTSDAGQRHRTVDVMRALCGLAADLGARVLVHGSPDQRALVAGEEDEGASAASIVLPRLPKRRRRRALSIASSRCRAARPSSSTPWRRLPRSCAPSTARRCAP